MGKIIEEKITTFSRGMTSEPREQNTRYAQLIKNFDVFSYPNKLVPHRNSEDGDSGASTSQKVNFLYANSRLYGLGVVSGQAYAEINYKTDYSNNSWSAPSNNASSAGAKADGLFVHYKNYIYGARASSTLWRHGDITGSPTWTDTWQSVSYSTVAQGLVHSKDDKLYIPYDNKIGSYDGSTWVAAALTLPTDKIITSICEYGNYLAIGTRPSAGIGKSRVYLWDRDSTLATVSESLDWGDGNLQILEEIEGILIGISYISTNNFTGKIVFRYYSGGTEVNIFQTLISEAAFSTSDLPIAKQKVDNYLYFLLSITLNGVKEQGLWKIGRISPSEPFSVVLDRTPNNDTALTSGTLQGFFIVGDYVFISYVSSATYAISKTNDQESYTGITGVYETLILNGDDSSQTKHLKGITATHEPLPSGGQVVIVAKFDEETSFSSALKTNTTQNTLRTTAIKDANGGTLPNYKEKVIRAQSNGGAILTGIKSKYEEINDDGY